MRVCVAVAGPRRGATCKYFPLIDILLAGGEGVSRNIARSTILINQQIIGGIFRRLAFEGGLQPERLSRTHQPIKPQIFRQHERLRLTCLGFHDFFENRQALIEANEHVYPAFKKFSHFKGNYGNAWWKQKEEFDTFNGPILLTTNCLVPPKDSYKDRVYTTGVVGFPGCKHIPGEIGEHKDFSAIIAHAKTCPAPTEIETGEIVGGFAHNQVLALADKVVDAVKSGAIKKFVVMAGCDGRMKSRSYYIEFAEGLSKDTVILTAGCAKYRYNKLPLGDIGGIPRVLDAGQCNDSYSLAVVALKLKEVFGLADINDLPIVYNIAWYEQKAVIVLLALLALGVKNIHVGPTLPAFLSPNVAKVLVEQFGIGGITTPQDDLKAFFG